MFLLLLCLMLSLFMVSVAGLLVIALREHLSENRPQRAEPDGLAYRVRQAFDPHDTRTGRVRLLLATMANREADVAGARRQSAGLHRATP